MKKKIAQLNKYLILEFISQLHFKLSLKKLIFKARIFILLLRKASFSNWTNLIFSKIHSIMKNRSGIFSKKVLESVTIYRNMTFTL